MQAMAASLHRLRTLALRNTCHIPSRRKVVSRQCLLRPLHSTPIHQYPDADPPSKPEFKFDINTLDPDERAEYDLLSPSEKKEVEEDHIAMHVHMTSPEVEAELNAEIAQAAFEVQQEYPSDNVRPKRITPGLMAMGEVDEQGSGEDEEYKGDDISSLAHGELEQHREKREYARIAAWEMPLLSSTSSTRSNIVRTMLSGQ